MRLENVKFMKRYKVPMDIMAKSEDIYELIQGDLEKVSWDMVRKELVVWRDMFTNVRMVEICSRCIEEFDKAELPSARKRFCMVMFTLIVKEYERLPGTFGKRKKRRSQ